MNRLSLFLFSGLFLLFISGSISMTDATETACTMEYAPVCGMVEVQCITAPCYPVRTDFSNMCMAKAAWATDITGGTCIMSETPAPIGGQRDIYGCLTGAGYSWSPLAKACLRPWESKVRIITIGPDTRTCSLGVMQTECLQIRRGMKWENFSSNIEGFDHIAGMTYRLRVLETRVDDPPADGSSVSYKLLKVISERYTALTYDENMLGDWYMIGYNDTDILALSSIQAKSLTLTISKDHYTAKICNSISGNYTLRDGVFQSRYMMSTKMACMDKLISDMESTWDLDGANYTISTVRYASGATGPDRWLTITTKDGDIYNYAR